MDNKFDPRRLRVSVEVDGQMKIYKGLQIHVIDEKNTGLSENTCKIELFNLNTETRNYLLIGISPFNKNRTRKRVIVEAGRQSTGLTKVFVGDMTTASLTQPPDIGLSLEARTGYWLESNRFLALEKIRSSFRACPGRLLMTRGLSLNFRQQINGFPIIALPVAHCVKWIRLDRQRVLMLLSMTIYWL
ncbi:MAG: hypothetical protein JSC189_000408 [Candidatus Tokpelaia sp. JSC189]|nr:MAG: hypothetical protein JSC189_000408 [Candidatus Tokpelaia sp. JSC189]